MNANQIAFIGLCREYCSALENARETERPEFIDMMLRLLPRLYISATDLAWAPDDNILGETDGYLENALDEDYYDSVRRGVGEVMEEDDVYLEVFEEDMKYSDTPVSASISEGLADIFQALYNFLNAIGPDATDETMAVAFTAVADDFRAYWSGTLCNVLRALNNIRYRE